MEGDFGEGTVGVGEFVEEEEGGVGVAFVEELRGLLGIELLLLDEDLARLAGVADGHDDDVRRYGGDDEGQD